MDWDADCNDKLQTPMLFDGADLTVQRPESATTQRRLEQGRRAGGKMSRLCHSTRLSSGVLVSHG